MDSKKYEALQKVIEFGSFSKAAETLGYTQPAISQMISSIEDEFSVKILERSRSGVQLTPEGKRLYPFFERVIAQEKSLRGAVDEIHGLDTGVVRIGSLTCVSNCWMPRLVYEFSQKYPNVAFEIRQGNYASVADWVKTGIVDIGFVNPLAVNGLETLPIRQGPMLAVLPKGHPLASLDRAIPLELLTKEPLILLGQDGYSEPLAAFEKAGLKPNIRLRIQDAFGVMAMVEAGLGVSIMFKMILERQSYKIELREIDPPITRTLSLVYRDWTTLPVASKRFIDLAKSSIPRLP